MLLSGFLNFFRASLSQVAYSFRAGLLRSIAKVTITYSFDRGSMARVINLASTLQKLSPVLQQCMTSALGPAADILSEPSVRVTPGLAPVIEALFPAGMPYVPRVDRL